MSARATKRGRSMAFTAGSPLVGRRHTKRAGKSPGPAASPGLTGSKGIAAPALATDESDIVLDRLGKEIIALLKEGGSKKDAVRRRLRLGINEVTKFLEATATATATAAASCSRDARPPSSTTTTSTSSCGAPGKGERPPKKACRGVDERPREGKGQGQEEGEDAGLPLTPLPTPPPVPGIVVFCRDVRPSRLVEHIHSLVKLTATPYLVLSGSSSSLGRVFGCKTMAAMAICPAQPPPPPPPPPAPLPHSHPSPDRDGKTEGGAGVEKLEAGGDHDGGGVTAGAETEEGSEGGETRGGSGEGDREGGRRCKDRGEGDSREMAQVGGGHGEKKKQEEEAGEGEREERSGGMAGSSVRGVRGMRGAEGTAGVSDDRARARADEDVDSFVEFLRRKIK